MQYIINENLLQTSFPHIFLNGNNQFDLLKYVKK